MCAAQSSVSYLRSSFLSNHDLVSSFFSPAAPFNTAKHASISAVAAIRASGRFGFGSGGRDLSVSKRPAVGVSVKGIYCAAWRITSTSTLSPQEIAVFWP
ncbi:Os05g0201800 [Oryza sativa Japonica Group]|uniref:Os05g0201800 protein n=1 Tax=Oryza sativa subsp. japonica TaxID=39947 RepID=A0A0P0WJ38_ORYSJ|nr:Os05g0201800 [Oryza sativa Japonica Group]